MFITVHLEELSIDLYGYCITSLFLKRGNTKEVLLLQGGRTQDGNKSVLVLPLASRGIYLSFCRCLGNNKKLGFFIITN